MTTEFRIEQKCRHCSKDYVTTVEKECCFPCFMKNMEKRFRKPKSFWYHLKEFTYCILLQGLPVFIVGYFIGFRAELIAMGFFFLGMYFWEIIRFCMRIF